MELLSVYHFQSKSSIGKDDFMNLCPSLIVHLDKEECRGSQAAGPSHDGEAEPQPRSLGSIPLSGNGNFTYYAWERYQESYEIFVCDNPSFSTPDT